MTTATTPDLFDASTDLVLTRDVPVTPEDLYRGWTEPDLLVQWFCPKPWGVAEAELDVRPGGGNRIVMQSPDGDRFPNEGCYLEVVPGRRLVITDTMRAGFRPVPDGMFNVAITFEPIEFEGKPGCRYTAHAMHVTEAKKQEHEKMGFHDGWGKALDQLVVLMSRWLIVDVALSKKCLPLGPP